MNASRQRAIDVPSATIVDAAFAIVLTTITLLHLHALKLRMSNFEMREPSDSAAMMQATWSITHGAPFTTTLHEVTTAYFAGNMLAEQLHFSLALFAPLVHLFESVSVFLYLQCLIVFVTGIIAYGYARQRLANPTLACLVCTAWLLNPAFIDTFQLYGFRIETLFLPLLLALFWALQSDRVVLATLCLVLALATKHNACAVGVILGVYFIIGERTRRVRVFGVLAILASLSYYLVAVKWYMGSLITDPTIAFKHLRALGDNEVEIIGNLVAHPSRLFTFISTTEWAYVKSVFFGSGLLSLAHPIFWLSLPQLIILAILDDYQSVTCAWHWALVMPFMYLAQIGFLRHVDSRHSSKPMRLGVTAALLVTIAVHAYGAVANTKFRQGAYIYRDRGDNIAISAAALAALPPNASVMASGQLLWLLWNREQLFTAAAKFHSEVDYLAIALPIGKSHYETTDLHMLLDVAENGGRKVAEFDEVYRDANLVIFRNRSIGNL
jgi:uncharacterized membrane protein